MRYPTLDITPLKALAKTFLGKEELEPDEQAQVKTYMVDRGSGETMDLRRLEERVKEMKSLHRELLDDLDYELEKPAFGITKDLDRIEGRLSELLHKGLKASRMPDEALDDKDFWQYLVMRYFWWLVVWRHDTGQAQDRSKQFKEGGKYLRYLNHGDPHISVLARMYIRADLALDEDGSYELAWRGRAAADLWQSHLIPVDTGRTPVLVRAILRRQATQPLATEALRECAKDITRSNTNVVPASWMDEDADDYVDHHWNKYLKKSNLEQKRH